jgi:uncharacterized membrane protein
MNEAHLANLAVHIGCGTVALALGFHILSKAKGTALHRRRGRVFIYFTGAVCASAAVGSAFFRFIPVFAVLSILVPYQLVGGWRSAMTREAGPQAFDALWTALALAVSTAIAPLLVNSPTGWGIVAASTLGALFAVLLYDIARWLFPRRWFRSLWIYEHSYKLIASQFGMLSALIGNVVRIGQPWSQIAPSVVGLMVVGYFFWKLGRGSPSVNPAA